MKSSEQPESTVEEKFVNVVTAKKVLTLYCEVLSKLIHGPESLKYSQEKLKGLERRLEAAQLYLVQIEKALEEGGETTNFH